MFKTPTPARVITIAAVVKDCPIVPKDRRDNLHSIAIGSVDITITAGNVPIERKDCGDSHGTVKTPGRIMIKTQAGNMNITHLL
jgi:hypothetical protein